MNSKRKPFPEIQIDDRLVELDFGDWEGMTWSHVHTHYEDQMSVWGQDWVNRSPPNGESFAEQVLRCNQWLQSWIELAPTDLSDGQDCSAQSAIAVTHGGSIRALICLCLGWPLNRAMSFRVDPASLCVLQQADPMEPWRVRMINSQHA